MAGGPGGHAPAETESGERLLGCAACGWTSWVVTEGDFYSGVRACACRRENRMEVRPDVAADESGLATRRMTHKMVKSLVSSFREFHGGDV